MDEEGGEAGFAANGFQDEGGVESDACGVVEPNQLLDEVEDVNGQNPPLCWRRRWDFLFKVFILRDLFIID